MLNDSTAKLLSKINVLKNGANTPTVRLEYECPCKKGKIVEERVSGFCDYSVDIECEECKTKYYALTGCGHMWELRNK